MAGNCKRLRLPLPSHSVLTHGDLHLVFRTQLGQQSRSAIPAPAVCSENVSRRALLTLSRLILVVSFLPEATQFPVELSFGDRTRVSSFLRCLAIWAMSVRWHLSRK